MKQNWFDTLNEALDAENIVELWPMGLNIAYGETAAVTVELNSKYHYISVYRDDNGLYERPVHYDC